MSAHFFITGGTGLVGADLVPRLLLRFPDSTMTLLVRGDGEEEARARVHGLVQRITRRDGLRDAGRRVTAVAGDVSLDHCGLSPSQIERIVGETTHIIHGAATIRFDRPIEEARAINCGGTRRALSLAQLCVERGRLERFVYIGSSSVSGRREGCIREDELEMGQTFFNTYEQSKCESERIVRDHFDRIPATVFRPSIIIGDSRTGATTTFNVIYIPLRLLYSGLLTFIPGTPTTTVDLVPVDWVNDAMVYIMSAPGSIGKVYHITAGPARAARLGEVVLTAARFFDARSPLARPREIRFIPPDEFPTMRAGMQGRALALMLQLDTLLPYISIDRLFDSRNADALLTGSGITFPRYAEYADKILDYCVRTNWGKRPPDNNQPQQISEGLHHEDA